MSEFDTDRLREEKEHIANYESVLSTMKRILPKFPELKQVDPEYANSPDFANHYDYVVDDIYGGTIGIEAVGKESFFL